MFAENLPPGMTIADEDHADGRCEHCGLWHEEPDGYDDDGVPECERMGYGGTYDWTMPTKEVM